MLGKLASTIAADISSPAMDPEGMHRKEAIANYKILVQFLFCNLEFYARYGGTLTNCRPSRDAI